MLRTMPTVSHSIDRMDDGPSAADRMSTSPVSTDGVLRSVFEAHSNILISDACFSSGRCGSIGLVRFRVQIGGGFCSDSDGGRRLGSGLLKMITFCEGSRFP